MQSHTNEVQRIDRCTTGCSQETQRYVLVHSGRLMTSRTRMTKLLEPIKAEGNEDVTKKDCQGC